MENVCVCTWVHACMCVHCSSRRVRRIYTFRSIYANFLRFAFSWLGNTDVLLSSGESDSVKDVLDSASWDREKKPSGKRGQQFLHGWPQKYCPRVLGLVDILLTCHSWYLPGVVPGQTLYQLTTISNEILVETDRPATLVMWVPLY